MIRFLRGSPRTQLSVESEERQGPLTALIVPTMLFITIILCFALGIFLGYVAVMGLLYAFGHSRERVHAAPVKLASAAAGSPGGD